MLTEVWPLLVAGAAAVIVAEWWAWLGRSMAGRRAAASVLSELRLALVARRVATQPTAADGAQSGEIAAAAVQGAEALEAYF